MTRVRAAWVGVLALNLAWALILPGRSAATLALAGAAIALLAVLLPLISSRGREYLRDVTGESATLQAPALLLPFLLPAISLVIAPRLAFWSLDGRSWLVLAWLWTGIAMSLRSDAALHGDRAPAVRPATLLFLFGTCALWLTVVSDLGIGRVVLETDRTVARPCRSDALTTAFSIWESNPVREHLFLGWRSVESFQNGAPYANHVHPYLLTMYAWTRAVRTVTGAAPYVATNTVPSLYMLVLITAFTTLLARAGMLRRRTDVTRLLTLFVAYGLVLTAWRFWNDLYRFGSDNPYPLLAAVFVLVYAFLLAPVRPVAAALSAAAFSALSPIHTPMLLVAVLILFGQGEATPARFLQRNRGLIAISLAALGAGVVSFLTPVMLISLKGYVAVGSSYVFRSGLDGDTRYFSNAAQAIFAPCPPAVCCSGRTAGPLLWPAFLPVLLGAAVWRRRPAPVSLGHLLLFLTTPYVMSVVLFPQSVSIHPYLYDHLLIIPAVVVGSASILIPAIEDRLRGAALLVFLLLSGVVLMANLVGLAQALAIMPR